MKNKLTILVSVLTILVISGVQAQQSPVQTGIITANRVKVRAKPLVMNSETVDYAQKNDTVTILDKTKLTDRIGNMEDYWYKVKLKNGRRGWIFGYYIKLAAENEAKAESDTGGVRAFRNIKYDYEFKYPRDCAVKEFFNGSSTVYFLIKKQEGDADERRIEFCVRLAENTDGRTLFRDAIVKTALSGWNNSRPEDSTRAETVSSQSVFISKRNLRGIELYLVLKSTDMANESKTAGPLYAFPVPNTENEVLYISPAESFQKDKDLEVLQGIIDTLRFSY